MAIKNDVVEEYPPVCQSLSVVIFIIEHCLLKCKHYILRKGKVSMANRVYRVNVPKIKELAEKKGTNLKQLELSAGVGNGAIAKWAATDAKIDTVCRVANALGTKVDALIEKP